MGFPLIPFAAGMAVGALATYGSRDATVQKQVKEGTQSLAAGTEWLYESVLAGVSGLFGLGSAPKGKPRATRVRAKAAIQEKPEAEAAAPVKRTRSRAAATAKKGGTTRARKSTAKVAAAL